jgi:hypothetical protein
VPLHKVVRLEFNAKTDSIFGVSQASKSDKMENGMADQVKRKDPANKNDLVPGSIILTDLT